MLSWGCAFLFIPQTRLGQQRGNVRCAHTVEQFNVAGIYLLPDLAKGGNHADPILLTQPSPPALGAASSIVNASHHSNDHPFPDINFPVRALGHTLLSARRKSLFHEKRLPRCPVVLSQCVPVYHICYCYDHYVGVAFTFSIHTRHARFICSIRFLYRLYLLRSLDHLQLRTGIAFCFACVNGL